MYGSFKTPDLSGVANLQEVPTLQGLPTLQGPPSFQGVPSSQGIPSPKGQPTLQGLPSLQGFPSFQDSCRQLLSAVTGNNTAAQADPAEPAAVTGASETVAPQVVVTESIAFQLPAHLLCLQQDWQQLAAQCRSLGIDAALIDQVRSPGSLLEQVNDDGLVIRRSSQHPLAKKQPTQSLLDVAW